MKLENLLTESFKRMRLKYSGTRPEYKIKDPNPYVLVIDDDYDVDGNGKSILGINLNYVNSDKAKLIDIKGQILHVKRQEQSIQVARRTEKKKIQGIG